MDQLRRVFDLPENAERLRKYKCALTSQPGVLFITTYHLCFIGGTRLLP